MNGSETKDYDLFLSYKREDAAAVQSARDALEADGIHCWMDPDIPPANEWDVAIPNAIARSRLLAVFVSAHSDAKPKQIKREIAVAEMAQTPLLFVRLDRSVLQSFIFFMATDQPLDFFPPHTLERSQAFVRAVHLVLKKVGTTTSLPPPPAALIPSAIPTRRSSPQKVSILYRRGVQPDETLLRYIEEKLTACGHQVFHDRHLNVGAEWFTVLEKKIRESDVVIPLLSARSVDSEMIGLEIKIAHESRQAAGKPRLLPVRVNFAGELPADLAPYLDRLQYFAWGEDNENEALAAALIQSLEQPPTPPPNLEAIRRELPSGAMPPTSTFYLDRTTDPLFHEAINYRDSIILVMGARQMGKTSLIARGLRGAREQKAQIVLTDLQRFNNEQLATLDIFYRTLSGMIADQLELKTFPENTWKKHLGPNENFHAFMRKNVLAGLPGHLFWAMDNVDRLFGHAFSSEAFGLFRSWHEQRSLDDTNTWTKLTMIIGFATEATLLIDDPNMSPFNVGTTVALNDFSAAEVAELNDRYGGPLRDAGEIDQLMRLVGGQPYLVRRSLFEMAVRRLSLKELAAHAGSDEGIFGDHLRRLFIRLTKDSQQTVLANSTRALLHDGSLPTQDAFYRLRSAGVLKGDSREEATMRCGIYATYFRRHLQ